LSSGDFVEMLDIRMFTSQSKGDKEKIVPKKEFSWNVLPLVIFLGKKRSFSHNDSATIGKSLMTLVRIFRCFLIFS
jgi:hypothetical protein